jgi:hypothetical protein
VGVGSASVEIVVVGNGHLLFARSADLGGGGAAGGEGETSLVQKIAIEAKRTWMSYRVSDESSIVDAVVVAGDGRLAKEIAERCGEALEMPWKVAAPAGGVELPRGAAEQERLAAVSVIGMLVEQASGRESLNFARPRRAPDLAAARRQRVLAGTLGAIVLGGMSWMYASHQLGGLRGELAELKARRQTLQTQYAGYVRDQARFDHARLWSSADIDWIGHARWISETMPDTRQAQLDEFGATLRPKLTFVSADGTYDPKDWQASSGAGFTIAGHVKRRDTADDIRRKLVSFYDQVESKGPDVPDRFAMDFSTRVVSPGGATRPSSGGPGGER